MRRFLALFVLLLLLAPGAQAEPTSGLRVKRADAAFAERDGEPRHRLTLRGVFPLTNALAGFDPVVDDLLVTVSGEEVLRRDASPDTTGVRFKRRRGVVCETSRRSTTGKPCG